MLKKIIFSLILFIAPLFSPVFMANAAELTKNCFSLTLGLIDNSATTTVYSNGTNWYSDSSCLKQTTLTIPRRSDKALPVYFNTKCAAEETTHSATGTVTYPTSVGATCTYSASDILVCNITPDKITSNTSYCADTFASPTNLTSITAGRSSASLTYSTCYAVTLNVNGGTPASVSVLYKKTGVTGWFTNSSCTTSYSTTTNIVPTRSGYTFRGYFSTDLEDATSNTSNKTLYIQNTGASTLAGASWTPTTNTTIYAAWAKNCATLANGTCKLEITTATGDTTYNASCNSGYTLDNDGTANPTCTSNCKVITLKYQNQNGSTNIEERTISYNGTNWCSDSSCGRCGASFVELFKRSDDALPAYFSTSSTTSNYTLINTGSIKEINDSNTAYTCSYTDGELNCNVIPSTTTLYAYVFVAPNLAGAVSGGGLLSFSTVSTNSKKTVTVSYKSATCSDAATVHFYGIKSDGTYGSVGTAKFYYDAENWGNSSGNIKTNFDGLGITNSFTNSVTFNGTTYPKGLSAYRAAWVGGEPRTQPTDMIITETTGIVSPDDNPYDIFVTGGANTLPNIIGELFSTTVPGSAKNVYYVLLYAANCVDPQGTVNHATCELTITPNGGAYYKNQCLSGYEKENMGTDTLPTTAITPVVVDINNICEI